MTILDSVKYAAMPLRYRLARFILLLRKAYPFLGELCMRVDKYLTLTEAIAATDGLHIYLNEDEVMKLPEEGFNFIMLHELFHIILGHTLPKDAPFYSKMYWNIACDLVANDVIISMQYELKRHGLPIQPLSHSHVCPDRLENDPSNVISAAFVKQAVQQGILTSTPPIAIELKWKSFSKVVPNDGAYIYDILSGADGVDEPTQAAVKELLEECMKSAGNDGLPQQLKDATVEFIRGRKVPWFVLLRRYLDASKHSSDFDFIPPDTRYLYRELILPGEVVDDTALNDALVVLDVSSSVSKDELFSQLWQVQQVLTSLEFSGTIIAFASAVHQEAPLSDKASLKRFVDELRVGGGTEWSSVVRYVEKRKKPPTATLVFTDGYFFSFTKGVPNAIFITQDSYPSVLDSLGKVVQIGH